MFVALLEINKRKKTLHCCKVFYNAPHIGESYNFDAMIDYSIILKSKT
jgi:hypothetical protein